ncbi:flagellar basal-body rod protein FlgF [Acidimangrovimonas sediminis]|uniref:flagellar basal-body rod protein FlgF n=1 Tax=Acidimangrovimonas sediminis TaxID=2056283 RepID=UPI000C807EEB|nr:flagellar basal-body rod protein FlgF [Acidimangrovimonas sediminis]
MDNSIYVSLSLALSLERSMDVTANNIANANTAGFKAGRADFASLVQKTGGGTDGQTGGDISFVNQSSAHLDPTPGPLQKTGNPLDLALSGDGWFSYRTAAGATAYGRDGRLSVDAQGNLVTVTGAQILDQSGNAIAVPQGSAGTLQVGADGTITDRTGATLGRIGVFTVPDIAGFQRADGGMLIPPEGAAAGATPATPEDDGVKVAQGYLEGSNVEPVLEMTRMMEIQRAYDRSMKLMDDQDSLRKQVLSQLGQIG